MPSALSGSARRHNALVFSVTIFDRIKQFLNVISDDVLGTTQSASSATISTGNRNA